MKTITVCDKCLTATCWHGEFMCDQSHEAGTVEKTREELLALNREHPDHWEGREVEQSPSPAR